MSAWLAENPEMLEAALELVETWDGSFFTKHELSSLPTATRSSRSSETDHPEDVHSSSSSESSPRQTAAPSLPVLEVTPAQAPVERRCLQPSTIRSTNHRRREEIEQLRNKLHELERQLASVRHLERARQQPMDGKEHSADQSLWRTIATRQHQLRTVAESTQADLRHRIDAQTKVARGLIKLMQKARRIESTVVIQSMAIPRAIITGRSLDLDGDDQLVRIQSLHARMDDMFSSPKFRDGSVQFLDVHQQQGRPGEFVIDISEAWNVPFDQHRVLDALWQHGFQRLNLKWCAPEFVQDTKFCVKESELAAYMNTAATIGPVRGAIDGRSLSKRFDGDGASSPAIISRYIGTPHTSDPGDFAGVCTVEESCVRVLPTHAVGSVDLISRVEFSQRVTVTFSIDASRRHHAELFTNLMQEKLRALVDLMHDVVETQLLSSNV